MATTTEHEAAADAASAARGRRTAPRAGGRRSTRSGSTCRRPWSSSVLFLVPTGVSFFFSLTRWTLFDWHFIGLDNFVAFFQEDALTKGLVNTLIYAFVTSCSRSSSGWRWHCC